MKRNTTIVGILCLLIASYSAGYGYATTAPMILGVGVLFALFPFLLFHLERRSRRLQAIEYSYPCRATLSEAHAEVFQSGAWLMRMPAKISMSTLYGIRYGVGLDEHEV